MKIGLVIEDFDPLRGGAEHWTFQHAVQLVAHGYEVHIVAGTVGETARRLPFTFHEFGVLRNRLEKAAAAERLLRRLSLDIIHDVGLGWHSDVFQSEDGSRLAQWDRMHSAHPALLRPFKRWTQRHLPRYTEFRELMRRQYSAPQRQIIAVSRMCAEDYQRLHDVPPERIHTVYHGTDIKRFSPRQRERFRGPLRAEFGVREDETLFIFVGHDFFRKGLRTAVSAVQRLAARGHAARLLVVGGREERGASRVAGETVLFTGRVHDAAAFYAAADAFVLPTFYDPCSLSVGEAAAAGLPVITTRFNGAGELITAGREGFVLDEPADDVALATAMEALLDPPVRMRMGAAARRLAEAYPLERNFHELTEIYAEAIASRDGCLPPRREFHRIA